MAKAGKPFTVHTEPTKQVVVDSLTRDASVKACIFDLIDNSVDAARDTLLADQPARAPKDSPDSFAAFQIKLTLSGTVFRIEDNCGGISVQRLKRTVLRFGERSTHEGGIGVFGVGLNRALFKLGRVGQLKTDTGAQRAEVVLKTDDYLADAKDWTLSALEFPSSGKVGTEIEIRQIPTDIAAEFASAQWVQRLRHEIGQRYGRLIEKHLSIHVNGVKANDEQVRIREDGPYEGEYKFLRPEDGVAIHIEYGQHESHRFSKEPDYDRDRNVSITDQYGWTVLCNDRAILIADRTHKTGWDTKFHTEFYGFVGVVSFVGTDPAKLPWNTMKTDVDLNNPTYQMALREMRAFAVTWRKLAEKRKKAAPPRPVPKKAKPKPNPRIKKSRTKGTSARPVSKDDHNEFRTVLPADIDERYCVDKHLALVHEAKHLDLVDIGTYSGLAVIRMLFECSVIKYLIRVNGYGALQKFAVDRRGRKVKLSEDDARDLTPNMEEILAFLTNNPTIWGSAKDLKHSLTRVSAHQKTLNSAVHNPFQPINRSLGFQIRDEVLPLLRHLIETGVPKDR